MDDLEFLGWVVCDKFNPIESFPYFSNGIVYYSSDKVDFGSIGSLACSGCKVVLFPSLPPENATAGLET